MSDIRFDNQVVLITGAGRGLGREYALAFAQRGAKVVVNDFGGARDGTGGSADLAQAVVDEIEAMQGQAMAHGASVTDASGVADMIDQVMARWGRIDVVINNAGVLRDKSFAKMALEDFRFVLDVHLTGAAITTKAVWEIMRAQGYGRVVFTTSSSGLYGSFGQANYGAAKLGLVGLMNTLKLEGQKSNIHVNALCPVAATRMTDDLLPAELQEKLTARSVAPAALYLASTEAPNGMILSAGAGVFSLVKIVETQGVNLGREATPETLRDHMNDVRDPAGEVTPFAGAEQVMKIFGRLQG